MKKYKIKKSESLKMKNILHFSILKEKSIRTIAGILVVSGVFIGITSNAIKKKQNTSTYETYIVLEGDTLSKIAQDYDTTIEELTKYNNIEDINKIEIGQKIVIPKIKEIQEKKYIDTKKIIEKWDDDLEEKGYVQGIDFAFDATEKNIDLDKVLNENPKIRYVIVRSNYFFNKKRKAGETDQQYKERCLASDEKIVEYAEIAKQHDVAFGIYYWPSFRGLERTKKEIEIVMNKIKELEKNSNYLTMPIFLDIEVEKDGGADLCERISKGHKETLECFEYTIDYFRKNGYEIMLYTGYNTRKFGVFDLAKQHNVEMWIARYKYEETAKIHIDRDLTEVEMKINYPHVGKQYVEGRVDGFNSAMDLDVFYENIPQRIVEEEKNNTENIKKEKRIVKIKKFFGISDN